VLKVKVKKSFPGFSLEVDFSVNEEILAILGPSGSGKTMTLKCIAGLLPPDEGHIELNGKVLFDSASRINLPPQQRKIGFVFQNYALFPHLTVNENTAYGIRHRPRHEVNARVSLLLEKMHIPGLGERYPRQLSSGQQQRVALARALSHEPEVLLLDEPFSALDTPRRERLELELLALQHFYRGDILFVTHDLAQGYKLGSRMAVYEAGRLVQLDSKHNVIASPTNRTAARLTGVKNLIEGHVTRIKDSEVWVMVPELKEPLRIMAEKAKNITPNQPVTIGIRPEYIQITDHPGENTILGMLSRIVEGVTTISYYFRAHTDAAARYELEASLAKPGAPDILEGQSYYLYLPAERLVIITE
jgi:molybdate transport system ATP-binding protein